MVWLWRLSLLLLYLEQRTTANIRHEPKYAHPILSLFYQQRCKRVTWGKSNFAFSVAFDLKIGVLCWEWLAGKRLLSDRFLAPYFFPDTRPQWMWHCHLFSVLFLRRRPRLPSPPLRLPAARPHYNALICRSGATENAKVLLPRVTLFADRDWCGRGKGRMFLPSTRMLS